MTTLTVTQARQNLFDLLKKALRGHVPIRITSKTGDAVLMSETDYESLMETLELLSLPGMAKSIREAKEDIKAGRTKSLKRDLRPMTYGPYEIRITRRAEKDIEKLSPKLKDKLFDILTEVIAKDPFEGKKLIGDLEGSYSYRLNYQDRIIYSVDNKKRVVYVERARTHYGE